MQIHRALEATQGPRALYSQRQLGKFTKQNILKIENEFYPQGCVIFLQKVVGMTGFALQMMGEGTLAGAVGLMHLSPTSPSFTRTCMGACVCVHVCAHVLWSVERSHSSACFLPATESSACYDVILPGEQHQSARSLFCIICMARPYYSSGGGVGFCFMNLSV